VTPTSDTTTQIGTIPRQVEAECQSIAQQQQSAAANAYNQAYASCMAAKEFPGL
jgi:hypothetical protein